MDILKLFLLSCVIFPALALWGSENIALEFEGALRRDQISWKFIVPNPRPVIETRLSLEDIHIFQIGIKAMTVMECCHCPIKIRAKADYGFVLDGDQKETLVGISYLDAPHQESHHSLTGRHIVDGQYVTDLSLGIGYPCHFCDCGVTLTPMVGYAYDAQSLRAHATQRDFFRNDEAPSPIPHSIDQCICNKYVLQWYGPWIGVDVSYDVCACFDLYGQFEYHFANLTGKRNSNIHFGPIDEYHRGTHHAHGSLVVLGAKYQFCSCWNVGMNVTYQDWKAHKRAYIGNALEKSGLVLPDTVSGDHMRVENTWRSFDVAFTVETLF